MKKILKAITFLSLAMCLMLNTNVVHAGTCYREIMNTETAYLKEKIELRIYIPFIELPLLDRTYIGRLNLQKEILGVLSTRSYSSKMLKLPNFEISESTAKNWYNIAKDNGSCGVVLVFYFSKDGKICVYNRVEPQYK